MVARAEVAWSTFAAWLLLLTAATVALQGALATHAALGPALVIDYTLTTVLVAWALLVPPGHLRPARLPMFVVAGLGAGLSLGLLSGSTAAALAGALELSVLGFTLWRARSLRQAYQAERARGADELSAAEHALTELFPERLAHAVAAETVGLHLLVSPWTATGAWVLTGLSVYSAFWLVGEGQALRLMPHHLGPDRLRVQVGLRWRTDVPYAVLRSAERIDEPGEDDLELVVPGAPRVRLVASRPVEVVGLFGIHKQVTQLVVPVDEPERLLEALEQAGVATRSRS